MCGATPCSSISAIIEPGALALPLDWINCRAVNGRLKRTIREQWQMSNPSSATAVATKALRAPFLKLDNVLICTCKERRLNCAHAKYLSFIGLRCKHLLSRFSQTFPHVRMTSLHTDYQSFGMDA